MKFKIYVVDDDRHYARMLSFRLEKNVDHDVHVFNRGEEMLEQLSGEPDMILLDIMMPGIGGMETLRQLKEGHPEVPVVMISAQGVIDVAVEAMQAGAYDYIAKGQDELVKLDAVVKNVREKVAMERELNNLRGEVKKRYSISGLVGESPVMQQVYKTIEKTLKGDLTVVVQGESGTGKELVAKAIHYNSARKKGPFVIVNCAAIPRELMESELFGHEKGSFTGAHARKIGKFEQSDGGTIFLDEIGELDLDLQAKLLRALQSYDLTRVGGNETIHFDTRVISATNRDIMARIREGKFREDLYYRLFQFPITLPPLRERGQDILRLADYFLKEYISKHPEFSGKHLSSSAKRSILDYAWPGNVRELKSAVERAVLIADSDEMQADDLMLFDRVAVSPWIERAVMARAGEGGAVGMQPDRPPVSKGAGSSRMPASAVVLGTDEQDIMSLDELKRQAVERAYQLCEGNVDRAAVELGIGRATMYRLLKKYDIMQ
ncbi:MAG: sigma-54-dependent Fis family transcriptional regulator [Rhodothermales bacterium]|nr:sigma-54-dependent Fis family transcriptional regulator [Rhodothermales bacterium]